MSDLLPNPAHDDIDDVRPPSLVEPLRGRAAVWRELTEASRSGRMHHAWLLQGVRGLGKASTGFAFARWLLGGPAVLRGDTTPEALRFDLGHPVCRQIALGSHPTFFHLARPPAERGEGFKTQITVDEVRKLNQFFQGTAAGSWRIALVDPADDMNRSAANALLKTLEEPPARSLFLIVNHQPGAILPTIRSRCRVLRFEELGETDLRAILLDQLPGSAEAERASAARTAGGRAREAFLALAGGGLEVDAQAERLYRAERPDWAAIHSVADALLQRGRETAAALFRDALLGRLADDARRAAMEGEGASAERFAALWQSETARWREASAYNLDRKQTILTFFQRLEAVRRGSFVET